MDFSWTEKQLAFKAEVIAFAQHALNDDLRNRDHHSIFSRENWRKCGQFGIQGLFIPEAYGGTGKDLLTTILALEGFGYGCEDNGLALNLNGQIWSVQQPILAFGSEAQKQKYLPGLCGGELLGADGITEPEAGSDAFQMQTRAEKKADGYLLNGNKWPIGLAPACDMALIFATTNPDAGQWGISAFLVDRETSGFRVSENHEKMGLRTTPIGEIILEDCFVPEENRLGPEGAGASIFNAAVEWERSFIFSSHVGAMERQLERAIQFSKKRRQFDQPIGKFQSVSNRVAEMKTRLELAKLLLYKAAWLKDQGKSAALEAAMTKLYISEAFAASSMDAVRIHGSRGFMTEFEVERDLRDAMGGVIFGGTSDIQRVVIARLLGL